MYCINEIFINLPARGKIKNIKRTVMQIKKSPKYRYKGSVYFLLLYQNKKQASFSC